MQYALPDDDQFYEVRGVAPPTRMPHMTLDDLEERFEDNRRKRACQWKQKGPEVFCDDCPNRHGIMVGTGMMLQGTDAKGLPMLKRV